MSTTLEKAWAELDGVVDEIANVADALRTEGDIDGAQTATLSELKSEARGMARVISLFMSAYYPTYVEVSHEAAKRRAHRTRGEAYESPGLGARRFQKEVKDVTDTREG